MRLVKKDGPFDGVCAGLGDYMDVDPVFIRLFFVAGAVMGGFIPAILVYIVLAICMENDGASYT